MGFTLQDLPRMCKNHHLPYEKNMRTFQTGLYRSLIVPLKTGSLIACGIPSLGNLVLASVSANRHKKQTPNIFFSGECVRN